MIRIEKYLNTTKQEVEKKTFNIWLGISLGNKYFTKEHIQAYIKWALRYTKENVLIVILDVLQAINIEVLDGKSKSIALRKAIKLGDSKYLEVQDIISKFPPEQQKKIKIARWGDMANSEQYQRNLQILKEEYAQDKTFRECILDIVKIGRQDRIEKISRLKREELDRLSEYILSEMPIFADGVQMNGTIYTLIPYPGITKLDELFIGLQNKTSFPKLAGKLCLTNKIAILDAYAD